MAVFLINNNAVTDPAINLALEEFCFRNLDPASDYLLFYINRPSIITGRHQNPFQECNLDLARRKDIQLVRRISGGGTVYHDRGNLNFSYITGFKEEKLDYFKTLLKPILNTLQHLGVPAELTDKNNILVKGKKISGNSQHTNMRRMLSHGTLLFESDLEALGRALEPELVITNSRAVISIRSNVTNIVEHLRRPLEMDTFRVELLEGPRCAPRCGEGVTLLTREVTNALLCLLMLGLRRCGPRWHRSRRCRSENFRTSWRRCGWRPEAGVCAR